MSSPENPSYRPGDELLPYQRRWADDPARWKFGLMSRQVGKDFASGFEGVADCVRHDARGGKTEWLIAAPSERQSLESLAKWKDWASAFKVSLADYKETRVESRESLLRSAEITFPHGGRVIAVPGRPDTVRGYSANVLLTEFAFFENPDATWRAILPTITNPLRGGEKKVRLITTPNGIGNKAHEIWAQNFLVPNAKWSCHFVNIHQAVAEGLPVNVAEMREALNDEDGWAQEFECQFLDVQSVLLSYDLIASCESRECGVAAPEDFWTTQSAAAAPVMGIDFGRSRDLTVAWTLAPQPGAVHTMEVLELAATSTPDQVAALRPRLARAGRVCLDYTGPGTGLGDYLAQEFGEWNPARGKFGKIELCVFSPALKAELFSKMRMDFERKAVRVPINRAVREDLHSVQRVAGAFGGVSYRAPRGAGGHADRSTALALALRAARETQSNCPPIRIFPGRETERAASGPANTSLFQ